MNLSDFFETNSTSLEVSELFEELCEEKSTKKAALNATRTTLCIEYLEEKDQSIIVLMSVYWCGLKSNIVDEKSKNELEKLTKDDIFVNGSLKKWVMSISLLYAVFQWDARLLFLLHVCLICLIILSVFLPTAVIQV